ncbi:MAG: glycosyltransferase N-terminal domain-containing protein, partial [Cyclobacteriaceae bacterium]
AKDMTLFLFLQPMGLSLYNISIKGYVTLVRLLAPFNKKARLFIEGRKELFPKLEAAFANNKQPVFWLHAASLGEFEQGRPVIEAYRKSFPDHRILLTFYSPSGYEIRKNYVGADDVFYLPPDSKQNAERFYDIVSPQIAVIVKYEFWYHYISEAGKRNIRLLSIATIIRTGHFILSGRGRFLAKQLHHFDHFFTQDEVTSGLLNGIGIRKTTVAGDTRYDRVAEIAANARKIEEVERFLNGNAAMVIGSSWPSDMEKLYPVISEFAGELQFIIAPHNINQSEIAAIIEKTGDQAIRFSQFGEESPEGKSILIVDNIGMLSSLYRYGRYAFIGGAFRGALHNILEAAVYGIPVFYGKHENNAKFLESQDLVSQGGAFEIETSEELISLIRTMEKEPQMRENAGLANAEWVTRSKGATGKIINYLTENNDR